MGGEKKFPKYFYFSYSHLCVSFQTVPMLKPPSLHAKLSSNLTFFRREGTCYPSYQRLRLQPRKALVTSPTLTLKMRSRMMLASHLILLANVLVLETSNSWSFFFTEKTCIYSHLFWLCNSCNENTTHFKTSTKIWYCGPSNRVFTYLQPTEKHMLI